MTTQTTLEHPARRARSAAAPAHLARVAELPPSRLAVIGLVAWIGLCALGSSRHALLSWHYFATAGQTLLASPGGLHVYGEHPELQFGPVTMALCAVIGLAPEPVGTVLACGLMLLLGLGVAALLGDLSRSCHRVRLSARTSLVYAALLAPLWLVLAVHYGHLDDALALLLMTAALAMVKRDRWIVAAVLLAAATGAKPWVLPMAVILLAAPGRARLKAGAVFVVAAVLPWIPFILADPRTMQLSRFEITVADDSVLRQIGSLAFATPTWDRPAQFLLGALLSVWLVRRGRALCVPFAVLSVRLLLDPQTYLYYSTGLVLAAAIADLARSDRRPILTALGFGWSAVATVLATTGQLTGAGTVRLVGLLAGLVAVVVDDGWSAPVRRAEPVVVEPVETTPVTSTSSATTLPVVEPVVRVVVEPVETTPSPASTAEPPKLGSLWSQTRKPLRPTTSSLLIRR